MLSHLCCVSETVYVKHGQGITIPLNPSDNLLLPPPTSLLPPPSSLLPPFSSLLPLPSPHLPLLSPLLLLVCVHKLLPFVCVHLICSSLSTTYKKNAN